MTTGKLDNIVLIKKIRSEYQERFNQEPSREEVVKFVREAFRSRNIQADQALVDQVVDHLLFGVDTGQVKGRNIRPC